MKIVFLNSHPIAYFSDLYKFLSKSGINFEVWYCSKYGIKKHYDKANISSMPFVAGNSAYLVDPFDIDSIHDGLNELCNNSTLRKQLIKNGFINSKRFLIKNIAEQHIKLYK